MENYREFIIYIIFSGPFCGWATGKAFPGMTIFAGR
jgi:hypothetical protein